MKYNRFEELPVRRAAVEMTVKVYAPTAGPAFKGQGSLRDQIERGRFRLKQRGRGFRARHRAGAVDVSLLRARLGREVRSMLCPLERLPAFGDLKSGWWVSLKSGSSPGRSVG